MKRQEPSKKKLKQIFGLGYSTRSIEAFIDLLKAHGIQTVIDIRTIPKSRYSPAFNQSSLKEALKKAKIGYRHLKKLGGLRHARKDSINTGWTNASFRGFADYMQSEEFLEGLEQLEKIAQKKNCAIMCAEGVPWRCHRSLIADALKLRKWKFFHIQSKKTCKPHKLTAFLHVRKGKLIYSETP